MQSIIRTAFKRSLPQTSKSQSLCWSYKSFKSYNTMSDLSVELTAPNGVKYTQPTGLFINNEWVKSSKGDKITSINPS